VVSSAVTHAPISGAKLAYKDFPESMAVTSSLGRFEMPEVRHWHVVVLGTDQKPSHGLLVSASGYQSQHVAVDLGGPTEYSIELMPVLQQR